MISIQESGVRIQKGEQKMETGWMVWVFILNPEFRILNTFHAPPHSEF